MTSSPAASLEFDRFTLPGRQQLAVLSTPKLKTVIVKVFYPADLDETVTARALLPMVLRRGTRELPDMQAVQRHLEGLYGASVQTGVSKVGEWHVVKFRLDVVNGRFLPGDEDVLREAIAFLRDLVSDPHLDAETFPRDEVEQEKQNLRLVIRSVVDNKDQYAFERLLHNMCADEPYRLYEYGEESAIEEIDERSLTAMWRRWREESPIAIYVAGDVDPGEMRDLFGEVFAAERSHPRALSPPPGLREPGAARHIEERRDVRQGKLCLGYRHASSYTEGDLEAMVLLNGILGGFSHSKLFREVRERRSLAYDVHSYLEKTKAFLFIVAGIAFDKYAEALAVIQDQLGALRRGEVSDEELVATRESLDNHLLMLEDGFADLMEIDYVWRLHGRQFELAEYRSALRDVQIDRIVAAAEQVRLDTVYFLRDEEETA